MGLFKRIWAVVIGTCAGIIVGILFDWLSQNGFVPQPGDERLIIYPWVAGGGALLGGIITALMTLNPSGSTRQVARQDSRRDRRTKQGRKAVETGSAESKGGSEIKSSGLDSIKLDHVEGMPSFDFDSAEGTKPAGKEKQTN